MRGPWDGYSEARSWHRGAVAWGWSDRHHTRAAIEVHIHSDYRFPNRSFYAPLLPLIRLNGAMRVVIASNKGVKMDIAKQLNAADEYIELDRQNPEGQWQKLKEDNPYGFDVVVEATGVEKLANDSINYVRRGGTKLPGQRITPQPWI